MRSLEFSRRWELLSSTTKPSTTSPSYNDAYDNARTGIEGYLEQYPTIQMVLDIHRDALVDSDGTVYKPSCKSTG